MGDSVPVMGFGGMMELRVEATDERRVSRLRLTSPTPVPQDIE